jgi:tetratricopeptide (TPR) repeat protein
LLRVETGELNAAYQQAQRLLRQRPDRARSHFALAYVLRYAGVLDESARECDAGLTLDPGDYKLRSCAHTFAQLGKYDRGTVFVEIDAGSEWAENARADLLMHQGRFEEALTVLQRLIGRSWDNGLRQACLERQPPIRIDSVLKEEEGRESTRRDTEPNYWVATYAAFCGRQQEALRLLRRAVEGNYCSYPAMDLEPWFESIRNTAEFGLIRDAGIACQKRFLAERTQERR